MTDSRKAPAAGESADLRFRDKTVKLPLVAGSEGELAIDIAKLRADTGLVTYDPGFGNTGARKSAITFIDGEKGIFRYRGYPIEDLAGKVGFLEVAYLLLHEDFRRFFDALPKDTHPMPVLSATIGALATFPRSGVSPARWT